MDGRKRFAYFAGAVFAVSFLAWGARLEQSIAASVPPVASEKRVLPKRFVVYSRPIGTRRDRLGEGAFYDMFIQPLDGGPPRPAGTNRSDPALGRSMANVRMDATGNYAAFLTDDALVPRAAPPRNTTVAAHLHTYAAWICSLQARRFWRVRVPGVVETFAWRPDDLLLAVEKYEPSNITDDRLKHEIVLCDARTGKITPFLRGQAFDVWAWWSRDAIIYSDWQSKKIVARSIQTGRVLHEWSAPDRTSRFELIFPSPNAKYLLIQTDEAVYLAQAPRWQWQKMLTGLRNVPLCRFQWTPDSARIIVEHENHYTDEAVSPPEPHYVYQISQVAPFAQALPTVPRVKLDNTSDPGSRRAFLFGFSRRENAVVVLRTGNSVSQNATGAAGKPTLPAAPATLEFVGSRGKKRVLSLANDIDGIDAHGL